MRTSGSAALHHRKGWHASAHCFFKGTQHPFRPHRRFHPLPSGAAFSGLFSLWHCRRFLFLRCVRHRSTFLRSLRSTSVTRLLRYFGRSDSCWSVPRPIHASALFSHELRTCSQQVSPIHRICLPDHSISTHPTCPRRRFITLPLSSTGLRFRGPGFTTC